MHPTIHQLEDEDQPSPSKKPRMLTHTQDSPPKRLISSPENSPSKKITGCSKTPVKSPKKDVYKTPMQETHTPTKTDELESGSNVYSATSFKGTYELQRKTPVKSPRKFVYKKPRQETRLHDASPSKTDELQRDSDMFSASAPSPIKPYGLEREINISSVTSKRSNELERDGDIFTATSSNKTDEFKGVKDVCGYELTSEVAVVKSVDCCPDDWVFQKREKAKVNIALAVFFFKTERSADMQ